MSIRVPLPSPTTTSSHARTTAKDTDRCEGMAAEKGRRCLADRACHNSNSVRSALKSPTTTGTCARRSSGTGEELHVHLDLRDDVIEPASPNEEASAECTRLYDRAASGMVANSLVDVSLAAAAAAANKGSPVSAAAAAATAARTYQAVLLRLAAMLLVRRPTDPEQFIVDYLYSQELATTLVVPNGRGAAIPTPPHRSEAEAEQQETSYGTSEGTANDADALPNPRSCAVVSWKDTRRARGAVRQPSSSPCENGGDDTTTHFRQGTREPSDAVLSSVHAVRSTSPCTTHTCTTMSNSQKGSDTLDSTTQKSSDTRIQFYDPDGTASADDATCARDRHRRGSSRNHPAAATSAAATAGSRGVTTMQHLLRGIAYGPGRRLAQKALQTLFDIQPSDPEHFLWTRLQSRSFGEDAAVSRRWVSAAAAGNTATSRSVADEDHMRSLALAHDDPVVQRLLRAVPVTCAAGDVVARGAVWLLLTRKPDDPVNFLFDHYSRRMSHVCMCHAKCSAAMEQLRTASARDSFSTSSSSSSSLSSTDSSLVLVSQPHRRWSAHTHSSSASRGAGGNESGRVVCSTPDEKENDDTERGDAACRVRHAGKTLSLSVHSTLLSTSASSSSSCSSTRANGGEGRPMPLMRGGSYGSLVDSLRHEPPHGPESRAGRHSSKTHPDRHTRRSHLHPRSHRRSHPHAPHAHHRRSVSTSHRSNVSSASCHRHRRHHHRGSRGAMSTIMQHSRSSMSSSCSQVGRRCTCMHAHSSRSRSHHHRSTSSELQAKRSCSLQELDREQDQQQQQQQQQLEELYLLPRRLSMLSEEAVRVSRTSTRDQGQGSRSSSSHNNNTLFAPQSGRGVAPLRSISVLSMSSPTVAASSSPSTIRREGAMDENDEDGRTSTLSSSSSSLTNPPTPPLWYADATPQQSNGAERAEPHASTLAQTPAFSATAKESGAAKHQEQCEEVTNELKQPQPQEQEQKMLEEDEVCQWRHSLVGVVEATQKDDITRRHRHRLASVSVGTMPNSAVLHTCTTVDAMVRREYEMQYLREAHRVRCMRQEVQTMSQECAFRVRAMAREPDNSAVIRVARVAREALDDTKRHLRFLEIQKAKMKRKIQAMCQSVVDVASTSVEATATPSTAGEI